MGETTKGMDQMGNNIPDKDLYTVAEFAAKAGVSDGLIYQAISKGEILTLSEEELLAIGLNPAVIKLPKRWISHSELAKFLQKDRKRAENIDWNREQKISAYGSATIEE